MMYEKTKYVRIKGIYSIFITNIFQKEQRKHVGLNVAHLLTFRNK